ncbi:hypothetical protein B7R21_18300 [Subtercola boreus]|uniref:Glycoside hydrolase family 2 n=1 Tax=Subtercola boreus TaxID=120213 RepID=A0A3E0VB98_9MICO|nr:glycoside hydrolase family 2 TIM barrel-domain containing protein [Subtercola boreus]RFA06803.1 hypothetical protein B7R21_18300 [Subtercola boreus]
MQDTPDFDAHEAPRAPLRASRQTTARPRPQLIRQHWAELDGLWRFSHDDQEIGENQLWHSPAHTLPSSITVPFPPESAASGVAADRFHDVVWYQRDVPWQTVLDAGFGTDRTRLHLHFGAVDYRAAVWVNGIFVGGHEGGHTPFGFDITNALLPGQTQLITVRAEDRADDVEQPRGKQDWQEDAHVIWYRRTTGIWQPVWIEATPEVHIVKAHFATTLSRGEVTYEVRLNRGAPVGTICRLVFLLGDDVIAETTIRLSASRFSGTVTIPRFTNGQDREAILWSPDSPTLIDVTITLETETTTLDLAASYFGFREVGVRDGHFTLNDRPFFVRSVLSQGYWPDSHLAAPSHDALVDEIDLILALGFNSARVHQKIEDPRFLYWADRRGLLLWAEAPAAYSFTPTAVERFTREWLEVLDRDRSHPSIVTWVPFNESWGIQDLEADPAQRAFVRALVQLTRALDTTRLVISNDGWEHLESDIFSVHDYDADGAVLKGRYLDAAAADRLRRGTGPAGRTMVLTKSLRHDAPLMLTEFGGIEFTPDPTVAPAGTWGYSSAATGEQFGERLGVIYGALQASSVLAGTCYTQLTDTMQEANGLLSDDRQPKIPLDRIRAIVTGNPERCVPVLSETREGEGLSRQGT